MMKSTESISTLSEKVKQKLSACKTQEELKQVLADSGVEPLDVNLLEDVAGGVRGFQDLDYEIAKSEAELYSPRWQDVLATGKWPRE